MNREFLVQVQLRLIFSLTEITHESSFVCEILTRILNADQNKKLQNVKHDMNCFVTEIYTHITSEAIKNIKSPLDNLEIEKGISET